MNINRDISGVCALAGDDEINVENGKNQTTHKIYLIRIR